MKTVPGETSAVIGKNDNKQTNRQTDRQTNKRLLGCETGEFYSRGRKAREGVMHGERLNSWRTVTGWVTLVVRLAYHTGTQRTSYAGRSRVILFIILYTLHIGAVIFACGWALSQSVLARSLARILNDAWIALCSVSGAALCARRALRQPTWLLIACTLRSQALLRHCTDSRTETLGQLLIISSA